MLKLAKWKKSLMLTSSRTYGQVAINCNGDFVDIWLRVNGKEVWIAVLRESLLKAIQENAKFRVLHAESDGNSE